MTTKVDLAVMGGGIVGLATAREFLSRWPERRVLLLEKEPTLAAHQTGHHSGIYYKPGSLKAVNCRAGKLAMQQFCQQENIPFDICGKVIVAVDESERPALARIFERGQANGVNCTMIGPERLAELEPHARGVAAIHVPEAGIIDYAQVCRRLGELITVQGGQIELGARVRAVEQRSGEVLIRTTKGDFTAALAVNCAGLHSDRVARLSGAQVSAKIVPFRGEYYKLRTEAETLCRNLIYPVPDPNFPFLGVHFTRMIQGGVECGPNAVLALAREGYRWRDVNLRDLFESLTYGGFLRLAAKYWRTGLGEIWRSLSRRAFVKALSRLVPEIRTQHLQVAPAGVRAQAVAPDGQMVDDFLIVPSDRVINVCNAPSPAATSSLNIGRLIIADLAERVR